jgi:dTDP-4-dehydrorhamnose reductase
MKILILGSNGQLGRELIRASWQDGTVVIPHDRSVTEISSAGAVSGALDGVRPDLVVNAAAFTAVDKAESEVEAAFAVNAEGPGHLAKACVLRDIPLVHISTDYVFDGNKDVAYVEDDPVGPMNVYGRSKCDGEERVRAMAERHVILRTSWVYSAFGNNFVKTMLRLGVERSALRVVADQVGAPTAAADLANCIVQMAPSVVSGDAIYGTYHVANSGETSWFGLAQTIFTDFAQRNGKKVEVSPITTSDYAVAARRPASSRLNTDKLERNFGIRLRCWEDALRDVLDELHMGKP